jgi:hypothetical protein
MKLRATGTTLQYDIKVRVDQSAATVRSKRTGNIGEGYGYESYRFTSYMHFSIVFLGQSTALIRTYAYI